MILSTKRIRGRLEWDDGYNNYKIDGECLNSFLDQYRGKNVLIMVQRHETTRTIKNPDDLPAPGEEV